jgi:Transglutaminase-like superfamily
MTRSSTKTQFTEPFLWVLTLFVLCFTTGRGYAQNAADPEAKPPLAKNPYVKYSDPWRWDIRSQIFLRTGVTYFNTSEPTRNTEQEQASTVRWPFGDLEVIFPVAREGGFYWSPNLKVTAEMRVGDLKIDTKPKRLYTKGTKAEYTSWSTENTEVVVRQIHLTHISHVVVADIEFDQVLARDLAWPDKWNDEANGFLSPVVDSVGFDIAPDAEDTIKALLDFWTDNHDPKEMNEIDLVKYLTGKVIEHVQIRTPPIERSTRSGNRIGSAAFVGTGAMSGFVVRSGDIVARNPIGSKHDLATLLCSVLRSAGVPARTLICFNMRETDIIEQMVSMVEFAMYDPERDQTFWIPIDVDRFRLNGRRSAQYLQPWYFLGRNDELNDFVPISYYFHPPASYIAFDLPALYGVRSSSDLPEYVIQSVLIDPQVSTSSGRSNTP